jgi:sugar phosphate isomerase/epimerase
MRAPNDRIAIDFISVLGMPPVDFIALAGELGCRQIGFAVQPVVLDTKNYAEWSLKTDAPLLRDVKAALKDHGVSIVVGEGFLFQPGADPSSYEEDMDILRDLGAARVNALTFDSDFNRGCDQFAKFAELAQRRGLKAVVEFVPDMLIGNLPTALKLVEQLKDAELGLVIDFMHLIRSGASAKDLAALDPSLIAYAQLCDVPLKSPYPSYGYEAAFERLCPGEGELPLMDILDALPKDIAIGLEIPMLGKAEAGVNAHDRLAPCVTAASALLG